jgi:hypothetical protein
MVTIDAISLGCINDSSHGINALHGVVTNHKSKNFVFKQGKKIILLERKFNICHTNVPGLPHTCSLPHFCMKHMSS